MWCDVLAVGSQRSEALAQLVYPVLQLISGVIDYSQGARNVAIRFHCVRMAQELAEAAGKMQNPVPQLLQCLDIADMKKRPKPSMAKKIDLNTTLHVGKLYLGTSQLHEFIADNVYEIMFGFLAGYGCDVSFQEIALPALVFLRRFKKVCQNQTLSRKVSGLIDKIGENIEWMNGVRAKVSFAPRDVEKAKMFASELKNKGESPIQNAWKKYSMQKDSMDKLQRKREVEESKRAEALKRKKEEEEEEDDEDDFDNMEEEEYGDEGNDFDDEEEEDEEEEEEEKEEEEKKKVEVKNKKKKQTFRKPPKKKKSKRN